MNALRSNSNLSIPVRFLSAVFFLLTVQASLAGSATWSTNPVGNSWNAPANWTPMTVPASPGDTATFATSNQTSISLSGSETIDGIVFNAGANQFTFGSSQGVSWAMSGAGITNNSGITQNFVLNGPLTFNNSATAGSLASFTNHSSTSFHNFASAGSAIFNTTSSTNITFDGSSTAGSATFNNGTNPVNITFNSSSTAGSATFTGSGSANFYANSNTGTATFNVPVNFHDSTSAGDATFNGAATFADLASAGHATIHGGSSFSGNSTAGTATLYGCTLAGNSTGEMARVIGSLEISTNAAPGVSVGSIEGTGFVSLGSNTLTVGTNNADTTFSGQIQSSTFGGLVKTGTGTFVLTNSNTYSGQTRIDNGTLRASHDGAFGVPFNGGVLQNHDVGGYISVASGAALTLDSGATNDYIANIANLIFVTGSSVNLNFAGNSDRVRSLIVDGVTQPPGVYGGPLSGAPNQLPQFTGTGTIVAVAKAVSRKVHGAAGAFDVDLPFAGSPGIECRDGGPSGDYQVVVTFVNNVTFNSASVFLGSGSVSSYSGDGTNTATINLTGVGNAQVLYMYIHNLDDGTGPANMIIPMGILIGDVNDNGTVNASDLAQVKTHLGQPVTSSNFRSDINPNGAINASDVIEVKLKSGTSLP